MILLMCVKQAVTFRMNDILHPNSHSHSNTPSPSGRGLGRGDTKSVILTTVNTSASETITTRNNPFRSDSALQGI
jgi:hypothetical protein